MLFVPDAIAGSDALQPTGGGDLGTPQAAGKYVPGSNYRVDVMASTGLYDDARKGIRRVTDPVLRGRDMDRDGKCYHGARGTYCFSFAKR